MTASVITLANRKGGTGKTTTAVNLAAELAALGARVLLLDLDSQGHAGFGFGVAAQRCDLTAHDAFRAIRCDLEQAVQKTNVPSVDCVPADRGFDGIVANQNPQCLTRALEPLRARYDFILIDTPPTSDPILINALVASDQVIVPALLHHLSFEGVAQFARAFFHVASGLSRNLRAMLILPNQVDLRVTVQRDVMTNLLRIYGDEHILDCIRADVALVEASGARAPVRLFRPRSRAAEDYARLGQRIAETLGYRAAHETPTLAAGGSRA